MNIELKNKFQKIVDAVHPTIQNANGWGCAESKSGGGSTLLYTTNLRQELPKLFEKFGIKTVLDIPCGDFNWMKEVDLTGVDYTGADILETLVYENKTKYPQYNFLHLDLTEDSLPQVDLIIVRDCFLHLSYENIKQSLSNIKNSKSTYLLVSSNKDLTENFDVPDSDFRQLNMTIEPFFISPIHTIIEEHSRCMILTRIDTLK